MLATLMGSHTANSTDNAISNMASVQQSFTTSTPSQSVDGSEGAHQVAPSQPVPHTQPHPTPHSPVPQQSFVAPPSQPRSQQQFIPQHPHSQPHHPHQPVPHRMYSPPPPVHPQSFQQPLPAAQPPYQHHSYAAHQPVVHTQHYSHDASLSAIHRKLDELSVSLSNPLRSSSPKISCKDLIECIRFLDENHESNSKQIESQKAEIVSLQEKVSNLTQRNYDLMESS